MAHSTAAPTGLAVRRAVGPPVTAPAGESPVIAVGRGRGIRTPDILLPKQARYQTALYPASGLCLKCVVIAQIAQTSTAPKTEDGR